MTGTGFDACFTSSKSTSLDGRGCGIDAISEVWLTHEAHLRTIAVPRVLEIGAGKDLRQNLYLSKVAHSQTVVDIAAMLDIEALNQAIVQLARLKPSIECVRCNDIDDLLEHYRIRYIAPLHLAGPGGSPFHDDEFNACTSTSTLEHIPRHELERTLVELKRIVCRGGLISAVIDYSDHYAHTDRNIGKLNYLKFSEAQYERYNHAHHYQNRLRHYHYVELFRQLDYEIVTEQALNFAPCPDSVSTDFDTNEPTLCATQGVFLLRNDK